MPDITDYEKGQIEAANQAGKPIVVFVHGLWLLPKQLGSLAHPVRIQGLRHP